MGGAVAAPGSCRPWGLIASLTWGLVAIAAWLAAQILIGEILLGFFDVTDDAALPENDGYFVSLVTIGAVLAPLTVVALAVRLARCGFAEYLGLHMPARRYVVIGFAILAVILPLVDLVSVLAGHPVSPKFVTDLYISARDSGTLLLVVVALAVAAPAVEEILFRGFLLPGLAASPLGAWGAILLSSLGWTVLHAQYESFYLAQIVVLGVVFGWLRLQSGSAALTVLLHALLNLAALLQAAVIVEWLS